MEDLTRRNAAAVIAGTLLVAWLGRNRRAQASATRLRAGGELTLRCPGAVAFHLDFPGYGEATVPAPNGRVTFRVPFPLDRTGHDEWTPLTCTPLGPDAALASPTVVDILTAPLRFGA